MRTPKRLYADERIIYHPELLTCPHCGDLLVMYNYLAWDKTVQTLDGVLSVASRPGHCPGEWPPLRHAASARVGSGAAMAGTVTTGHPRLSHCWSSQSVQS